MMTNRFAFTAAKSARWLPHRINPLQGRLQFVQMTRASYENNSFLDDRLVPANDQKHTISIPSASQVSSRPTVDFIFHGAFCGSTLLSRCLDIPGSRLAVREPLILRQLFEIRRLHGSRFGKRKMSQLLKLAMHYLGKGFTADEKVLIKPSNLCNVFIEDLLQMTDSRAILLSVGLEDFLISAIKKGPASLAKFTWVLEGLLTTETIEHMPGHIAARIRRPTHLEAAAMVWLLQSKQFEDLVHGRFRHRLKAIRFENFLDRPITGLKRIVTFLEHRPAHRLVDATPLKYNAKETSSPYSTHQRQLEARYIRKACGRQIDAVLHWVGAGLEFGETAVVRPSNYQQSVRAS